MAKKEKEKEGVDPLAKLVNLTKLIKNEKVKIEPRGPGRSDNKWRSKDPKFSPKADSSKETVEAGGMRVDPSLKDEYENWRKDKLAEQEERRRQAKRKAEAAAARAKAAQQKQSNPE